MAKIKVNEVTVRIPHGFEKLQPMPEDPEGSTPYGYETEDAQGFLLISAITPENAMPFQDNQLIIDSIHAYLGEDQGLVQVESGKTQDGRAYVFSIVKSKADPDGIQYTLTMQVDFNTWVLNIQGFFDEKGPTGVREAAVLEMLQQQGRLTNSMKGWAMDPYDASYKKGLLMNISEYAHLDSRFPGHPLTMLRTFEKYVVENN